MHVPSRCRVLAPRLVAVCLMIASGASLAQSDAPASSRGLREADASTGSHIRRYGVKPGPIPIDRPYAALTPAEQGVWNRQYEGIKPGDEPPFPAEGLKALYGPLHQAQTRLKVGHGELSLEATVAANGEVLEVRTLSDPDRRFTEFAQQLLLLTPFKPAVCEGQPCQMDFPLRLTLGRQMR